MKTLQGISVSAGIGIGNPVIIENLSDAVIPAVHIEQNQHEAGWNRFISAIEQTKKHFLSLTDNSNKEQAAIFETYIMMLEDPVFISQIQSAYTAASYNIEYVVRCQAEEMASKLREANDLYLNERAADILDVFGKVIHIMLGKPLQTTGHITPETIVVAQSLQVSEVMDLFQKHIAGLVLAEGGANSHLAILARSYGIPAVFGVVLSEKADCIIVDGSAGTVICNPDTGTLEAYQKQKHQDEQRKIRLESYIHRPAVTKDGVPFKLYANIGSVEEAKTAEKEGADGIGLFRTEFLFMQAADQNELLDEETQFNAYKSVLHIMQEKPVTIRTLDAGGDKVLSSEVKSEHEEANPLLGNRGIRFCLSRPDIFKTQIRALLRAGLYGNLKIMLPLLTGLQQLDDAKKIFAATASELSAEGIPYKTDIPVGIMVETPAAAILADLFAQKCDFFSIGTNDLTQYTLSIDRENTFVHNLFDDCNNAVLRLIRNTVQCADTAGIPVSVCGEMAGRPDGISHLAAAGIRSFSMTAQNISGIKELLATHTLNELCLLQKQELNETHY